MTPEQIAENSVKSIIGDLSGRSGIGSEWDATDGETAAEIVDTWEKLILQHLKQSNVETAPITPKELALMFHNTYELLAPLFGYETRKDTRKFEEDTSNGRLMIAVCNELLRNGVLYPQKP